VLGFIIQARMTSTRLPGKVLKTILDKPLLEYQLERLMRVPQVDKIIIATTTNSTDDGIVDFCEKRDFLFYRGSETDVLSRYYEAARQYKISEIIRVTSDCPVIEPRILSELIRLFNSEPDIDYASNTIERSYPRGLDAEIFKFSAIEIAQREATTLFQREHVTPYLYQNPQLFKLRNLKSLEDRSDIRLTVDTPEDLEFMKKIIAELYPQKPQFELADILAVLEKEPQLSKINSHIKQKVV